MLKITRKINFYRCFFGEEFSKHILLQFDCNSNVFFHVITKFIKLCQPTQTYTHLHTSIIKQTTTLNKKQSLGKCFLTFFFDDFVSLLLTLTLRFFRLRGFTLR